MERTLQVEIQSLELKSVKTPFTFETELRAALGARAANGRRILRSPVQRPDPQGWRGATLRKGQHDAGEYGDFAGARGSARRRSVAGTARPIEESGKFDGGICERARTAVLFDLDGTLADTAPDLGYALNQQRLARGMPELPIESVRVACVFRRTRTVEDRLQHRTGSKRLRGHARRISGYLREESRPQQRPLSRASPRFWRRSNNTACPGASSPTRRNDSPSPCSARLALLERAACVICGDTTPNPKPHPAPLLAAARKARNVPRPHCLYVGDDERDVQAGHAAGMPVIVARYGYLGNGAPPERGVRTVIIDSPTELLGFLFGGVKAGNLIKCITPAIEDSGRRHLSFQWGRPGFDVGYEAAQGMPRSSHLVKQLEIL